MSLQRVTRVSCLAFILLFSLGGAKLALANGDCSTCSRKSLPPRLHVEPVAIEEAGLADVEHVWDRCSPILQSNAEDCSMTGEALQCTVNALNHGDKRDESVIFNECYKDLGDATYQATSAAYRAAVRRGKRKQRPSRYRAAWLANGNVIEGDGIELATNRVRFEDWPEEKLSQEKRYQERCAYFMQAIAYALLDNGYWMHPKEFFGEILPNISGCPSSTVYFDLARPVRNFPDASVRQLIYYRMQHLHRKPEKTTMPPVSTAQQEIQDYLLAGRENTRADETVSAKDPYQYNSFNFLNYPGDREAFILNMMSWLESIGVTFEDALPQTGWLGLPAVNRAGFYNTLEWFLFNVKRRMQNPLFIEEVLKADLERTIDQAQLYSARVRFAPPTASQACRADYQPGDWYGDMAHRGRLSPTPGRLWRPQGHSILVTGYVRRILNQEQGTYKVLSVCFHDPNRLWKRLKRPECRSEELQTEDYSSLAYKAPKWLYQKDQQGNVLVDKEIPRNNYWHTFKRLKAEGQEAQQCIDVNLFAHLMVGIYSDDGAKTSHVTRMAKWLKDHRHVEPATYKKPAVSRSISFSSGFTEFNPGQ